MSGNPGGVSGRHGRRPMPGRYRVDVPGQREARVRDPVPGIMRGDPGPDALPPDVDIRVMPCPARLHCPRARGPVGQLTAGPLPTGCGSFLLTTAGIRVFCGCGTSLSGDLPARGVP